MNANLLPLLLSGIASFVAVLGVRKFRGHARAHRQVGRSVLRLLLGLEADQWLSSEWLDISLMDTGENVDPGFLVHLLRYYERHGLIESVVRSLPRGDGNLREVRFYRLTPNGRAHWQEYV